MTGGERERQALSDALELIDQKCPWCPTGRHKLRWTGTRWQIQLIHTARCPVAWSANHRSLATDYLISVLELYVLVGHYGEEHLVRHVRLVVL